MATNRWIAAQQFQSQVNTITVGATVGNTYTYTVTVGVRTVTYTANGSDTATTVATALQALLAACAFGEFQEITWANPSAGVVTGTAKTAGTPFTQTSAATGSSATLVTSTTTANKSPSDVNDAANWSNAAVPGASDAIYIDTITTPLLWNLSALSAVTVGAITIGRQFTGQIGLPDVNPNGYREYRPTYLAIGCSSPVQIGAGTAALGSGSGRIRLNFGSTTPSITCYYMASSLTQGIEALNILGSAITSIAMYGGTGSVAPDGGDTSTVTTLQVSAAAPGSTTPTFRAGPGATLTTVINAGGNLQLNSGFTTFTNFSGTTNIYGTGSQTTVNANGGAIYDQSSGTLGTLNIPGGNYDLSRATVAKTISNTIQLYAKAIYNDPAYRVATPAFKLNGCLESQVSVNIGPNRTLTVS